MLFGRFIDNTAEEIKVRTMLGEKRSAKKRKENKIESAAAFVFASLPHPFWFLSDLMPKFCVMNMNAIIWFWSLLWWRSWRSSTVVAIVISIVRAYRIMPRICHTDSHTHRMCRTMILICIQYKHLCLCMFCFANCVCEYQAQAKLLYKGKPNNFKRNKCLLSRT